jgi:hypothetical protein
LKAKPHPVPTSLTYFHCERHVDSILLAFQTGLGYASDIRPMFLGNVIACSAAIAVLEATGRLCRFGCLCVYDVCAGTRTWHLKHSQPRARRMDAGSLQ